MPKKAPVTETLTVRIDGRTADRFRKTKDSTGYNEAIVARLAFAQFFSAHNTPDKVITAVRSSLARG